MASGPAALLIGFLLVGTSMFCVVQSAAELSCQFPVSGSYATHVSRYIDESVGFTVATNYALAWLISFPSELIGCALTISYWNQTVNPAVWVAIFYVFIMVLNLFGVRGFAETEFALSIIKVIAIFIFIIIGIVLIAGGGLTLLVILAPNTGTTQVPSQNLSSRICVTHSFLLLFPLVVVS